MEWHLNDLSLRGQFEGSDAIKIAITPFLVLRVKRHDLRSRIYCSKSLLGRPATSTQTLQQALVETHDREFYSAAIRWLGNAGPFWDDSRVCHDEDLFYWKDEDVTDQGLGEAARRRLAAIDAACFSFVEPGDEFDTNVLELTHGLLEEPFGQIEVPNYRTLEAIETSRVVELTNWENMLVVASANTGLQLAPGIIEFLRPRPFHAGIAERLLQLLAILDEISAEAIPDGALTDKGVQLVQLYFVGKKALFSDEDDKGTDVFRFPDPDGGEDLHCSWHGKVKMGGQFRIHFQWPKPKGQERLKVVYIGEKLTKR